MKVLLAASPDRPATASILAEVRRIVATHAEIVAEIHADSAADRKSVV